MKKLSIFILAIGLISLFSCKKDEKVVLEYFTPAQILTPTAGTTYVLKEENKDAILFTCTWSAATYNLTSLVKPTYTLQMDTAGNNFADAIVLSSTQDYSFSITVGAMNDYILGVFKGLGIALQLSSSGLQVHYRKIIQLPTMFRQSLTLRLHRILLLFMLLRSIFLAMRPQLAGITPRLWK